MNEQTGYISEEASSDDSPTGFAPNQVLPVANLHPSFDGVPQDGMEYLFTVRRDSRLLPRYTRSNYPVNAPSPKLSISPLLEDLGTFVALPDEAWRSAFALNFVNYRKNLEADSERDLPTDETLPTSQSRETWWRYITGYEHAEDDMSIGSSREHSDSEEEDEPLALNQTEADNVSPHEPNVGRIYQLPGRLIIQLLYWHSLWITAFLEPENIHSISSRRPQPIHQRWMFALLGRLDEHLHGQDISTLRSLARACIAYIKHTAINEEEENLAGYWMVIAATVEYWGQKDIWDEARSELTRIKR